MAATGSAQAGLVSQGFQPLPAGQTVGSPVEFTSIPFVQIDGAFDGTEALADRSFTADWLLPAALVDGLEIDLEAEALFEIKHFDRNVLRLDMSISNTTIVDPGIIASILSFGFGAEPDVSASITDAGAVFDGIGDGSGPQQTFPGGFKQIDVCIFAANGCSGGNVKDGLAAGQSDSLSLSLAPLTGDFDGDDGNPHLRLLAFPIKFQGTFGSFEFVAFPDTPVPMPLPSTLALMGLGLLGGGLARRHLRRQS
ncbi:MAG: PEP-CTERM sorting domain-containing protein [Alphaproteobacteria bacterium]|nr:MAG: PEP-CTERM sorting domain-containing protein [Alphaproteobacteria bacterium]